MDHLVFVYGTLLKGEPNNRLLKTSKFLGPERVCGLSMRDLVYYPACIPDADVQKAVVGEVWEVDDQTFHSLDGLEGYPNFYDRIQVPTFAGKAWIYINFDAENEPEIESGDWRLHLGK